MSYRERHPEMHQEEDHVAWRGVVAFLGMVAVVSAALVAWTVSIVQGSFRALRPSGVFMEQALGPRHTVSRVREDLFAEQRRTEPLNARKRRELSSYGWVDRERGIVRIPIEQAIDLVAGGKRP
jgi:hypothetical protein